MLMHHVCGEGCRVLTARLPVPLRCPQALAVYSLLPVPDSRAMQLCCAAALWAYYRTMLHLEAWYISVEWSGAAARLAPQAHRFIACLRVVALCMSRLLVDVALGWVARHFSVHL